MRDFEKFFEARDALLRLSEAHTEQSVCIPTLGAFNWAGDYFDVVARDNHSVALRVVDDTGGDQSVSFLEMANRSRQVAAFLGTLGIARGDRLLVMLSSGVALWEIVLAAIRAGVVIIPATTLLEGEELRDRLERGNVKAVITESVLAVRFAGLLGSRVGIVVGERKAGWVSYARSRESVAIFEAAATRADELLLLYFTSGTTARPKLVAHTHVSYPVGHLSTMCWLGTKPGDIHLNLSSPGWAKHAWSSLFAPWNAQATILAYHYERFDPCALLQKLVDCRVTTFCAPPTVWRMLIQHDLKSYPVTLRECTSAGEPLNPEVIAQVHSAWGINIRDGFGQTETTAVVGNLPGLAIKPGSMGRPLPGYAVVLIDDEGRHAGEGEICLDLAKAPVGLMRGYLDEPELTDAAMQGGYFHTGDVASRDADGYLTYVGRRDDLFKSSDYRISPFELESVLLEHPAVIEAAVVPSPDSIRLSVPKAFVTLAAGVESGADIAASIFAHVRARISPFKRIRRLEFASLPKTVSGKIRRIDLRMAERNRGTDPSCTRREYLEEDFVLRK